MITFIRLKNWKSHRDTELRFGDGTNVLVGMMGAGKSSVMEGITYALFGTLPAIQARRIKLEDVITSRPKAQSRAEVEVGFQTPEGGEFVVRRVVERGSGTVLSELRKASGELVEGPNASRVTEMIGTLLDLDYDLFERAIYSEQNRLDYFLTLQRGRRMESIDELLGINKLEKARKAIGSLVNKSADRAEEREIAADNLRQDPSISALPSYKQQLLDLNISSQLIATQLGRLRPEIDSARAQEQKFRDMEHELRAVDQAHKSLEGAIGALGKNIEQIRQRLGASADALLDKISAEMTNLERQHQEGSSRLNKLSSEFTAAALRLQSLETENRLLRGEQERLSVEIERKRQAMAKLKTLNPDELADQVEKLRAKLHSVDDELAGHRARIKDLKQAMTELESAEALCPVCETPLDEARKRELLHQRQGELSDLDQRVNEDQASSVGIGQELSRAQELHQESLLLQREAEDLPRLENEQSKLSGRLSEVEVDLSNFKEKSDGLTVDVEKARKDVEGLRDGLTAARQTLQNKIDLDARTAERKLKLEESARLQQSLARIRQDYDEARADAVRKRLEELVGEQERLRAELRGQEQLMAEKQKLVDSVQEKVMLVRRYDAEVRYLREAAQALGTIQTALARTQTTMRKLFVEGVNLVMSDLWESIYPYGDFVGIQLAVEEGDRGGDYVLQLRDRSGNWIPVDGIASGGERTDAALALRISFSMVLAPKLKWIVFDEPTHNLDAEGIQELAKVLRERLPEFVRQILLITHEERLESAVSGYLYRFTRDKSTDEPTRAEQATSPELY